MGTQGSSGLALSSSESQMPGTTRDIAVSMLARLTRIADQAMLTTLTPLVMMSSPPQLTVRWPLLREPTAQLPLWSSSRLTLPTQLTLLSLTPSQLP